LAVPAAVAITYFPVFVKHSIIMVVQGVENYDNMMPRETKLDVVLAGRPDLEKLAKRCWSCHLNGLEVSSPLE